VCTALYASGTSTVIHIPLSVMQLRKWWSWEFSSTCLCSSCSQASTFSNSFLLSALATSFIVCWSHRFFGRKFLCDVYASSSEGLGNHQQMGRWGFIDDWMVLIVYLAFWTRRTHQLKSYSLVGDEHYHNEPLVGVWKACVLNHSQVLPVSFGTIMATLSSFFILPAFSD